MRDENTVTLPKKISPKKYAKMQHFSPLSKKEKRRGKKGIKIYGKDELLPWSTIYNKIKIGVPYEDLEYEFGQIRKIILWAIEDNIKYDKDIAKIFDDTIDVRLRQKELAKKDIDAITTIQEAVNVYMPDVYKQVTTFAQTVIQKSIKLANEDESTSNDMKNLTQAVQTVTDTLGVTERFASGVNIANAQVQVSGFDFVLDAPPEPESIEAEIEEKETLSED